MIFYICLHQQYLIQNRSYAICIQKSLKTKNTYTIPVARNMIQKMDRISSPAHVEKLHNAVDFITPKGTPVFATA